jgi:hypothetical protein
MSHQWDELSKSLAEESLPRRESLRRIGAVLAGAVLSPLGLGTAWGAGKDRCKVFCNQCPRSRRSNCLYACRNCSNDPSRLCGDCWSGWSCPDFANDVRNCGACGSVCWPGPFEDSACFDGACVYTCVEGAVYCDGFCTFLRWDPNNCGACGNVCPADTACSGGVCGECGGEQVNCGGECVYLSSDQQHCGTCFNDCGSFRCVEGVCVSLEE